MLQEKRLIPNFIQDQFEQGHLQGHLEAFAMFIDLSGFTSLTEALMKRGTEGAEQLSIILNNIFEPMVGLVYREGGFIPYFAGDAFTAIFPMQASGISAERFLFTAQQIRGLFASKKSGQTKFGDFKIGIKIGIKIGLAAGNVDWGIIGSNNKAFYFRGEAIDDCAESEHQATDRDIILNKKLYARFSTPSLFKPHSGDYFKLSGTIASPPPPKSIFKPSPCHPSTLSMFLPDAVLNYNHPGEFRNVISLFISFKGIDDHVTLDSFVSVILDHINNFSGYFKEVDFGDKGGVLVCFFGAPVSFENNIERALEFIYAVQEDLAFLKENTPLSVRVGITSGLAYAGIVGGEERCQYAIVGNRVNLAARLMIYADWEEILVDERIQKNRHFKFKHKGDTNYKGIEGSVPTYELLGRSIEEKPDFSGKMIGRNKELHSLLHFARPILKRQFAGICYIYGEAGIGKSRLAYELKKALRKDAHVNWLVCQADQILKKPFNPFVFLLKNYFGQSPENTQKDNIENFEKRFSWLINDSKNILHPEGEEIQKEIFRTKTVLAALIGISYPNSLWGQLDAKGRHQNTLSAISHLIIAESLINPLVLELEDAHWFDDNSKEFLWDFARKVNKYPIFILVTSRYNDDGSKPVLFPAHLVKKQKFPILEIDLNILSPKALRIFAEDHLGAPISDEFFKLLKRTTSGNPFYLEQILEYFSETNLLAFSDDTWEIKDKNVKLSTSINAILMARIDRLSNLVKETVKAAAVIGREFEVPVLSEVMKSQEEFLRRNGNSNAILTEQIKTAEKGQIWRAVNELRYIFKHSLLREAVYDMQLNTRLRELHKAIAEAIEKLYADNLEEKYVDLAFHYEQAEVEPKAMLYQQKAADHARRNYQNQQALDFYDKLLVTLIKNDDQEEIVKTLLKKSNVLKLIGQWSECQELLQQALSYAQKLVDRLLLGRTNNSLGHLLMLQGNYNQAKSYLETAAAFFKKIGDTVGIYKVYGNLGNLHFRQGNYEEAKAYFTKSIALSKEVSNPTTTAQIVSNLGLAHMNQGNYDEGISCQEAQLKVSAQINDSQGMATLYTNMGIVYFEKGDYDAALRCYEMGLALSEDLGNKQLTAIAIGCIGSVYERKGDYIRAMDNFQKDLELCEELGDKQGIAIGLGLIGDLYSVTGEFDKAIDCLERKLELCEKLNYQKGIAKAVNTLGDVFAFQEKFEKALQSYDRAIEVTRKINNRLVLGLSLIDKGSVLISTNDCKNAKVVNKEATDLANALGNSELIFETTILDAKIARCENNSQAAEQTLKELLKNNLNYKEQAAVHYELCKSFPDNNIHKIRALELYRSLYKETPQYQFKIRIEELKTL